MRVIGRQARGDVVDHDQHALGVRALDCVRGAPDLVEQGGGCAAGLRVVAVLNRKILAYDLLESSAVGRLRAEALPLLA